MKFQISFDLNDLDKAIEIANKVVQYADILEVGSILIYKYGVKSIEEFKKNFPDKTILADIKIIDRSKPSVTLMSEAGADWITVMAGTSKEVIHMACKTAHSLGKKIMLDLIDSDSPGQSALDAKSLGADALLFHSPYDEEKPLVFLDDWDMIIGNTELPVFVSAKINRDNINDIIQLDPSGIIIGKAIVGADNPEEEAKFFHDLIKK